MTMSSVGWPVDVPANAFAGKDFGLSAAGRWLRGLIAALPWEAAGWVLLAGLLMLGAPWAYSRAVHNSACDFPEFHAAGRALYAHGLRDPEGVFRYYWPSLDVAFVLVGWMPLGVAALVWYGVQVAAWLGLLVSISNNFLPDWPAKQRRQAILATGLLLMPLVLNHLCLGAFHILMVYWLFAGLSRVSLGKWKSGAVLLGLAVWIKLLPGLAVAYLFWKGKWKPALLAAATTVLIHGGLCLMGYGLAGTVAHHERWWSRQAQGVTARILTSQEFPIELRSRNQGLAAILRRTLTATGISDNTIVFEVSHFSFASFSTQQVKALYYVAQGCLLAMLAWQFRRRAGDMTSGAWMREISLVCLGTMWFSPIVWSYHHISATPAMAVILMRGEARRGKVWLIIGLWVLSLGLIGIPTVRAYGGMYWMSLALGGAVLWASRIEGCTGSAAHAAACPLA